MNLTEVKNWSDDWKNVDPFYEDIKITNYIRSGHTACLEATSTVTNHVFIIFVKDFINMTLAGKVGKEGRIVGTFEVCKRGTSLGIRLVDVPNFKNVYRVNQTLIRLMPFTTSDYRWKGPLFYET